MNEYRPLVIIAGPTAVGKTAASVELAKRINGEIISADSAQVYQKMDIGTAKVRPEEMQGIRHHLIDIIDPGEEYDVTRFQQMAKQAVEEIYERGKVPILVGGTGFYIQALLYDVCFEEETDSKIRTELEKEAETEEGLDAIYQELKQVDPKYCETTHKNNKKRVIRALSFYRETGMPLSEHNEEQRKRESSYRSCFFVLTDERTALYQRIDQRVEEMMKAGLLEEAKQLLCRGHLSRTARTAIGYKELYAALEGKCSIEEAVREIKKNSRHYAKRQMTWFRREKETVWIDISQYHRDIGLVVKEMQRVLEEKGI